MSVDTAALSETAPAISLLLFPEDLLLKLLALVPCPSRKQLRFACKHLCKLVNSTFHTLHLDRDLQDLLLAPPPLPLRPPSPLSFLSRLPLLPTCILHRSINPNHLRALLPLLPSLTALSSLSLPLTQDFIPHLAAPPSLLSLRLTTHIPAVRFYSPSSSTDPLPLSPFTTLTHLTLRCTTDAPATPSPLPGLPSLANCTLLQSLNLRYSTSSRYILDGQISAAHWLDPLSTLPLLSTLTLVLDHTCDSTWDPPLDFALPPLPHLTHLTSQSDYGSLLATLDSCPALRSLTLLPPRTYSTTSWPLPPPWPTPIPTLPHLTHLVAPGHLLTLPNAPPLPSLRSLTLLPALEPSTPPAPLLRAIGALLPHLADLTLTQTPHNPPLSSFHALLAPLLSSHPKMRDLSVHRSPALPPDLEYQEHQEEEYDTNVQHLRLMWFATCAENDGADVIYHERPGR